MLSLALPVDIYLSTMPADMRKSFDGLMALAVNHLGRDPLSGGLFVFLNRRRDRMKLLYWDAGGLAVWAKRLEAEASRSRSSAAPEEHRAAAKSSRHRRRTEDVSVLRQTWHVIGEVVTERLALRQERDVPLWGLMKRWLDEQYAAVSSRSAMGGAIGYALGNWQALLRYTEDGDISIDNNLVEQMLKLVAIGRKNWLFAGSERGGHTAAALFTLISSAKRHGLNTWAYLRDVLWRLADLKPGELEELLPDR